MKDEDHRPVCIQRRAAVKSSTVAANLQAIADGPIMDPIRIYLPAGQLSEADWRARERRILSGQSS
jgi:hypothetical protein